VEHRTAAWFDPLRFRDRLRADPALVQRYGQLKRELAATHGRDIRGYSEGKTAFVRDVLGLDRVPGRYGLGST